MNCLGLAARTLTKVAPAARGQHRNIYRRSLPSQTKKTKQTTKDEPTLKEPKLNLSPDQNPSNNSILHQKAARAAELHAELNALLESQAKRQAEEANRALGAGFLDFIRKSKSEMINIFAAFTCVLLAWQISGMKKGARKLLGELEDRRDEVEELKGLLRNLGSSEFCDEVLREIEVELTKHDSDGSGAKPGVSSFFWRKRTNDMGNSLSAESSKEMVKNVLRPVLEKKMQKIIGDSALTDIELEEKKMRELQMAMGIQADGRRTSSQQANSKDNFSKSNNNVTDKSLSGLEEVLVEVQREEGPDSRTIVKRNKGFI